MRTIRFTIFLFGILITSCETRTVKFSGLNDLVIGVHQVVLYENGEFYLELGAGAKEGKYEIVNDTVNLKYYDEQNDFPNQLLMNQEYFITIPTDKHIRSIKIKRDPY